MVYYRCKVKHAPMKANKYSKEFYCGLCEKFYLKDECEFVKPQEMYNAGMVKKRVPADIIIEQPKIVVQHRRKNK